VPQHAPILVVCAVLCGTAAAQVPSFRRPPIPEYQEATFLGANTCTPDPYGEHCSRHTNKVYTILIQGKPYELQPAFTLPLMTMIHILLSPGNRASAVLPGDNVLAHAAPDALVQVHFDDEGVDVRVLAQSSKGPRYLSSHYTFAAAPADGSGSP
jgi:hypothetical protein